MNTNKQAYLQLYKVQELTLNKYIYIYKEINGLKTLAIIFAISCHSCEDSTYSISTATSFLGANFSIGKQISTRKTARTRTTDFTELIIKITMSQNQSKFGITLGRLREHYRLQSPQHSTLKSLLILVCDRSRWYILLTV